MARTLYDKIWDAHRVADLGEETLLYIDRQILHEVSSPRAFAGLAKAGRPVRRPEKQLALADHAVPERHERGGMRARDADFAAAQGEYVGGGGRGRLCAVRRSQGPYAGHDRPDRRVGRRLLDTLASGSAIRQIVKP